MELLLAPFGIMLDDLTGFYLNLAVIAAITTIAAARIIWWD